MPKNLLSYISAGFLLSVSLVAILISPAQADGVALGNLWVSQYYNNTSISGSPALNRIEYDIDFDWGNGSPASFVNTDSFSARYTTTQDLPAGLYRFWALADDRVRITVNGQVVVNTFDTSIVDQVVNGDINLTNGQHQITVEYVEFSGPAFLKVDYANLTIGESGPDFQQQQPQTQQPQIGEWVARYYANTNLNGNPVAIIGNQVPRADWGYGTPVAALPNDQWSARYETTKIFNQGDYVFRVRADDGVRVYANGELLIDEWNQATGTIYTAVKHLNAGMHNITVEYYESGGTASLDFNIDSVDLSNTTTSTTTTTTPATNTTTGTANIDTYTNAIGTVVVTTGRLNVRDAPNPFTGQILTKVSEGDTLRVFEFNDSRTWVKVDANGVTGWINAGYTRYTAFEGTSLNSRQYLVTASPYTVNIRSGPGTRFDDIGNFQDGDTATVVGRNTDSTWWQINYDGIVGWVSARYAKIQSWANTSQIPVTG